MPSEWGAMSFGLFSLVTSILVALASIYLYRRLLRDTAAPHALRWAGIVVLVLGGPGFILARQLRKSVPYPYSGWLTAAQWSWAIFVGYLLVALLVVGLVRRFRQRATAPVSPERRVFLARATAGAAVTLAGGGVGYGYWRAWGAVPELREVAIRVPKLPAALSGFSIVQLTDVHVGSIIDRRFIDEIVARTNGASPDLVAITGDLVDGTPTQLGHAVAGLANLKSRHGTFFVTGNHEYHSNDLVWAEALSGLGLNVLRNRSVRIGDGAAGFDLVGVDDWSGGRRRGGRGYDLHKATAGLSPDYARVLLAHQPANFVQAARAGVGLQLSGHTHGGQVFPMTELIRLHWEHAAGLYSHDEAHLFVSRGTGFWGPPLRIGSPPEIVKLVLLPA